MATSARIGVFDVRATWVIFEPLALKVDLLQVVQRWIYLIVAMWVALMPALTQAQDLKDIRPRPLAWALEAVRTGDWDTAATLAARDGPVAQDIIEWHRLQAGLGSYAEVTAFLQRRADWPGLRLVRRRSEAVVVETGPDAVRAFFAEMAAQTGEGVLAHAETLIADGQKEAAEAVLRKAWLTISLSDTEQAAFLARHEGLIAPMIPDRLNAMLWKRWHENARRILPKASKDHQALAEARIALQRRLKTVDALIAKVPQGLQGHPGLAHDRFEWRVRKGLWDSAKVLLLDQSATKAKLGEPSAWANRRRQLARDELRDGAAKRAYVMAAAHHLDTGSHYADLEWLAGYIALRRLDDPARALEHFQNHDDAVRSPISQGRAGYWKGLAHLAMNNPAAADQEFTRGAAHQSSFYGLLAAEAAGLPFDVGLDQVPTEDWRGSPLTADSLFEAGQLLAASGERSLAEQFWTHLAEQLGERDAALLGQAAIDAGEPHLAVMIGKAVARRGLIVPTPYYPLHPLAKAKLPVDTELALAIARRESEFDPVVVSGAGARGLMQLMPATAKEVAGQLGLSEQHSTARLTEDPVYNARLGTVYLAELAERFDGNPVMVSAGYNAGPSRPQRWMGERGDPRAKDIETMVDWIEMIPFRETRNYVMRVTESLPIFRARLGREALPVPFSQELLGAGLAN